MASTAVFNVVMAGAGALSGVVIARAAGPAVSGEYSAVTSWLGITLMVAGLGQPVALVCFYVAKDPLAGQRLVRRHLAGPDDARDRRHDGRRCCAAWRWPRPCSRVAIPG